MVDITRAYIGISTPKMDGVKTPRKPGSREPFDIESLIDVINREGIADLRARVTERDLMHLKNIRYI